MRGVRGLLRAVRGGARFGVELLRNRRVARQLVERLGLDLSGEIPLPFPVASLVADRGGADAMDAAELAITELPGAVVPLDRLPVRRRLARHGQVIANRTDAPRAFFAGMTWPTIFSVMVCAGTPGAAAMCETFTR